MVFFNDPVPCDDPALRAVRMALAMRERVGELAVEGGTGTGTTSTSASGSRRGFATVGRIGFEGRADYAAIGTVTNLAARLCDAAGPGQVLVSQRVLAATEDAVQAERIDDLPLKGFSKPVRVFNVVGIEDAYAGAT